MEKIELKKLLTVEIGAKQTVEIAGMIDNLGLSEVASDEKVSGKITIVKFDETLFVKGDFVAEVNLICDRCLEIFEAHIPFHLERDYNINRSRESVEDLFVDKFGRIDLTEPIREEIILNIALHNFCKNDCLGICQGCGVNINQKKCCCKIKKKE